MVLLQFLSDHIAVSLVALVLFIAVAAFLAQKLLGTKEAQHSPSTNSASSNTQTQKELKDDAHLDQSPAAKAFRAKLKDISLDLDKN